MLQKSLGEFEEIVLLVVAILEGEAYSVSIIAQIEERLHREASLGAVQTVLKRLEDKGLLLSEFGATTKARGGKRKRLYEITAKGQDILDQTRQQRNSLYEAIPNFSVKLI